MKNGMCKKKRESFIGIERTEFLRREKLHKNKKGYDTYVLTYNDEEQRIDFQRQEHNDERTR
jgi:hypothetical protein